MWLYHSFSRSFRDAGLLLAERGVIASYESIRLSGVLHYLWRALDQHGVVLDILVQERRNATAAKRFFQRLVTGLQYKLRRIVTDGLRSYRAAHREILPGV